MNSYNIVLIFGLLFFKISIHTSFGSALIDVTSHVCNNDSDSQILDRQLGSNLRRTFGHLFLDCTNNDLLPSGDDRGATSCFGGFRKILRQCGSSIDLQMPNDDVCPIEGGVFTAPCATLLPYPAYSVGPAMDWRIYYDNLVQACAVLDNGESGNIDGIDPSLSETSVNFLCSVDRTWSMSDSDSDSNDDENNVYFQFTYCWIGGTTRNAAIQDDTERAETDYYYQAVIDSDCSNGAPNDEAASNILCVASVIDVTYSGPEEDVIVTGPSDAKSDTFGGAGIGWWSNMDTRTSGSIANLRSQLQWMCSNDFETAIGYKAYTCTFEGVPSETEDFDSSKRVFVEFSKDDCITTSKLSSDSDDSDETGIVNEQPYGDNCLAFLRSYSHYAGLQEGLWQILTPNEEFNDEIEGPAMTFVLATNENANAYLQATFLCPV